MSDLPVEGLQARPGTIRPPVRLSRPHRGPQTLLQPRSGPGPPDTQLHRLLGYYPSVHTATALSDSFSPSFFMYRFDLAGPFCWSSRPAPAAQLSVLRERRPCTSSIPPVTSECLVAGKR